MSTAKGVISIRKVAPYFWGWLWIPILKSGSILLVFIKSHNKVLLGSQNSKDQPHNMLILSQKFPSNKVECSSNLIFVLHPLWIRLQMVPFISCYHTPSLWNKVYLTILVVLIIISWWNQQGISKYVSWYLASNIHCISWSCGLGHPVLPDTLVWRI